MTYFEKIDEYITDCVKAGQPHDTFAVSEEDSGKLIEEAMETCDGGCKSWKCGYLPKYSLSKVDQQITGIIGRYHGVNIVRKP